MDEVASTLPVKPLLAEKLAEVAAVVGGADSVLRAFDIFVRTAGDDAVVRMNPVHFAEQQGFATGAPYQRARSAWLAPRQMNAAHSSSNTDARSKGFRADIAAGQCSSNMERRVLLRFRTSAVVPVEQPWITSCYPRDSCSLQRQP